MDMGPSDLPAWYWVSGASFLGFSLLDKVASHVQNVEMVPFVHALIAATCGLGVLAEQGPAFWTDYLQRCMMCMPATSVLERLAPMITVGFAAKDLMDGIVRGRKDFMLHGAALSVVFAGICHLRMEHHVVMMLTMEVSTIFLNLMKYPFKDDSLKMVNDASFCFSFWIFRNILTPYFWYAYVREHFRLEALGRPSCLPPAMIYFVILGGLVFHGLNLYWFVLIVRKMMRRWRGKGGVSSDKWE